MPNEDQEFFDTVAKMQAQWQKNEQETEDDQKVEQQYNQIEDALNNLLTAFREFDTLLYEFDPHVYEKWKAGGKAVADNWSMYPTAKQAFDSL